MNKRALLCAVGLVVLSIISNFIFHTSDPEIAGRALANPVAHFLGFCFGLAILGSITYWIVAKFFHGRNKSAEDLDPNLAGTMVNLPRQINIKLLTALGLLLALSVALNIYQIELRTLPTVGGYLSALNTTVEWHDYEMEFSGVAISLQNKEGNLKDGYQVFSGSIRTRPDAPLSLECQITDTIVLNDIVNCDPPFKSQDRPCEVLHFDGTQQVATVQSNDIVFNVTGKNATWQDKADSGPLVTVLDRIFHNEKYK